VRRAVDTLATEVPAVKDDFFFAFSINNSNLFNFNAMSCVVFLPGVA
jgi:hypothetical protein